MYMKRCLLIVMAAAMFAGCNKDKFKTEPQVVIKSFGPSEVVNKGFFSLSGVIRDKEGDLQDSITFYRKYYNGTVLFRQDSVLKFDLATLNVPAQDEMTFSLDFTYGEIRTNYIFQSLEQADRYLVIGVQVRDNAGHKSEYVESERILLKKL
jgi:hypothetical protein